MKQLTGIFRILLFSSLVAGISSCSKYYLSVAGDIGAHNYVEVCENVEYVGTFSVDMSSRQDRSFKVIQDKVRQQFGDKAIVTNVKRDIKKSLFGEKLVSVTFDVIRCNE